MRCGICVPNLGEFVDPRKVAELARRAENTGWDGFFVWDHVVFPYGVQQVADPWVTLTVVALATERIRFGPMVTAVGRRRPGTLARQTTSIDRLSGGRLIFSAGLGWTLEAEFGTWGESVEPAAIAQRLDEGLSVLTALWSGEPVDFHGKQLTASNVTFQPTPVQQPRPPIWIGGSGRPALRRVAERGDGWIPQGTPRKQMPDDIAYVLEHREKVRPGVPIDFGFICEYVYIGDATWEFPDYTVSGSVQRIVDKLNAMGEIGVNHLQIRLRARDLDELCDQIAAFGSEIGPHLVSGDPA